MSELDNTASLATTSSSSGTVMTRKGKGKAPSLLKGASKQKKSTNGKAKSKVTGKTRNIFPKPVVFVPIMNVPDETDNVPSEDAGCPIFSLRQRFQDNSLDLNLCLLADGKLKIQLGQSSLVVEKGDVNIILQSISHGCTSSDSLAIFPTIYLKNDVKYMTIRHGFNTSGLTFPFIQEPLLKIMKVFASINKIRCSVEKETIKNDIECIVIHSLYSYYLRVNTIYEHLCPACTYPTTPSGNGNGRGGDSRHFCGTEQITRNIFVPQSHVRACEDLATYELRPDVSFKGGSELAEQVIKLYSIFNIQEPYIMGSKEMMEIKIRQTCLMTNDSKLTEVIDRTLTQVIYDRFFYRDVEMFSMPRFPSINSMVEFGN